MKLPARLWLLAGVALLGLIGLGLVLQLINQLTWQLSAVLPYSLVGPVLLILLLLVLAGGLQIGWPLLRPWLEPRLPPWLRQRLPKAGLPPHRASAARPEPAASRREAASRNLEAIDRTLEQVRSAVEREALRQERERMATELERGDLQIVLFGSGSTGKTCLIRALLRELVGEVGAAMGSTSTSQRYRLRLRGLRRAVWLVDTPGILEAGGEGERRERLARQQASRADLLLLVVDGDLRASEREVFEALAGLGKRLMLVLNKCDLRGEQEEMRLLQLLRQRSGGRIAAADVVPTAASPQSIPQPGGRPLQPEPEVEALVRRIAEVLHADGEDLIADNLLLQCRRLGEASRRLLARQRRADALAVVERTMWIGAGVVAVTPLPGVDLLGAAAVNAQMVLEIGRVYGIGLSRDDAQQLAVSVGKTLAGLGLVKGGVGLLSSAMAVTLPAALVGRAIQAVGAAWLTRVAGLSFIRYFEQNQTWGDGGVQEVVQEQYDLSRRAGALSRFLDAAFSRLVDPLQGERTRRLPPRGPRGGEAAADRDDPTG
ncbi:MAG: YcjF family protein [Cyanobacteriota bacterium]